MTSHRPPPSADAQPGLSRPELRLDVEARLAAREQDVHVQMLLERERRLLEAQKHDSLGVLAGGIAHDFNNLLAVIIGQVELVASEPGMSPKAQLALSSAIGAAQRAAGLTRQLLDYAGRSQLRQRTFCMVEATRELVRSLRAKLPANLSIEHRADAVQLLVSGDSDRLEQSLLNLIANAVEACGDRAAAVCVSLSREHVEDVQRLAPHPPEPVRPGEYVCVEVRDDGPGMAPTTLHRVFEPFFTTKASGRGLGLAASLGVVRAHGGFITARSEPERGATFRVYLPLMSGTSADQTRVLAAPSALQPGARVVLVVDDEPMIRTFARDMLEDEGFVVLEAGSGNDALEILRRDHATIGGVLLDLSMPGMDGAAVLSTLRTFAPDLPVVLQTGYSAEVTAQRLAQWRVHGILQKPYRCAQLLQMITALFSETRPS
jgi:signal transduction histidine kinase/ActR/RegA family two-component response regulator